MSCIFTIDVEDWFHILDLRTAPSMDSWHTLPSRVERNFTRLLDLVEEYGCRSTCFFLGWVADRFPHLVREAHVRGHEIASHGYAHQLLYRMTAQEFYADAERARLVLEDKSGSSVIGFRAPGFSVTPETPWFFEQLAAAGYAYDSSIFPARRGHGGYAGAECVPSTVMITPGSGVKEFPISTATVLSHPLCFFGGGYLRLFPWPIIRAMANRVLAENRPVIFYVHPRDIDPDQPRMPMGRVREFKSYVNLRTTETKIEKLLREFSPTSFRNAYAADPLLQPRWNVAPTLVQSMAG